jgi:erythromycin esterase-like protein
VSVLPRATIAALRLAAEPLTDGEAGDYDGLLKLIGEARVVLLGVSLLGTHELFRARAELTTRLIKDKGFVALAVPAESIGVERLHAFVLGRTEDTLAVTALGDLNSSPRWLWRNAEMLDFVGWLRNYNDQFSGETHKVHIQPAHSDASRKTVMWCGSSTIDHGRTGERRDVFRASFVRYSGTTIVGTGADGRPSRETVPPPHAESLEAVCHALEIPRFYLPLRGLPPHLVESLSAAQFDAIVYFDETRALEPLDVE